MLEIHAVLALFTLLVVAAGAFFASKWLKVPYTVLLVLIGILIVPLASLPGVGNIIGFLADLHLTPELLFYIFLPALIFESAFNMKLRRMIDSAWTISLLALLGVVIAALLVGYGLYALLPLVGVQIPFIVAMLFGAIISATDPVAVLALFKEYKVPKRLTMIFEGESLFNDGTAVALYLVILGIIQQGNFSGQTVLDGSLMFVGMVVLGIVFGLLMAAIFSRGLRLTRSNELVTITLILISTHVVFILSELINETGLFGLEIHISSIIAATISALFLGNYSRHILPPKTDAYLGSVIELVAFIANSLVFLLAGLLFAQLDVDFSTLIVPILVTVLVVAVVRVVSVLMVTLPINALGIEEKLPGSWIALLSWGSLRGALAIIIVVLLPDDLTVPGWTLPYSVRELLLALTVGCILATLFIKAPFIGPLIRRLSINKPAPIERAYELDLSLYYLYAALSRFGQYKTRGFVRDHEYTGLKTSVKTHIQELTETRDQLIATGGTKPFEQSLYLMAIHIEKVALQQLYVNQEISERVYRRIHGKLSLQTEKIEYAKHDSIDPSKYMDRKDVFDALMLRMQRLGGSSAEFTLEERLQYYRAQMIMARKVTKYLQQLQYEMSEPLFTPAVYEKIMALYTRYKEQSSRKVDDLIKQHNAELAGYMAELAERSLRASGKRTLEHLHSLGIASEEVEASIAVHLNLRAN